MRIKNVISKTARVMALTMAVTIMTPMASVPMPVEASSIRLSKKNATIKVGQTIILKVKGTKKQVKWSSSKSSVAKVTKKGKVTGKKAGSAKITAKVKGKKLICKITVKSKSKKTINPQTPVKSNNPLIKETNLPQSTNTPDENKSPNRTQTPFETEKPNVTIVPNVTNVPWKTNEPIWNVTSTPQNTDVPGENKNPIGTQMPIGTIIPKDTLTPILTEKPEKTVTPNETKTPVNLALNFYLEPFDPERPNSQFVYVHLVNHTKEDVYIETEAYMTTKGENYPAMIGDTKEGHLERIEPVPEDDNYGQQLLYDSKEYVMGNYTDETFWLKSDENSTFTFFFWIGEKRYRATINYDQGGAIFTEASDTDVLQPIVTNTPSTEKPEETKTPVKLPLSFYLEPYNAEAPNVQGLYVHFVNHTQQYVYVETEAYVTTKGVNYPAMIFDTKEGDLIEVNPHDLNDTVGSTDIFESKENVMGNYTDETFWLKLDENSTLTFFFRIGNKRYHATIGYDQGGAIFTEALDTDVLQPIETSTPIKENIYME